MPMGFSSRGYGREDEKTQARSSCEDRACCLASSLGSKGILDETVAVCRQPVDRCQTLPPRWRLLSESTRSPPFHEKVTRFDWTASASHLAACRALSRTLPRPTGGSFPESLVSAREKMKKNAIFQKVAGITRLCGSVPHGGVWTVLYAIPSHESRACDASVRSSFPVRAFSLTV